MPPKEKKKSNPNKLKKYIIWLGTSGSSLLQEA
jgi:hypothetical protein